MQVGTNQQSGAGRSHVISPPYLNTYKYSSVISPVGSIAQHPQSHAGSLATRLNDEYRAGAGSSSSYQRNNNNNGECSTQSQTRNVDTKVSSYTATTTTLPPTQRSTSGHGKLHKRGGSGSSLPAPPSPMAYSQFTTPFATYEEPMPDLSATPPLSSTPKIKPYMRKMSASKLEEQGRLDLSKSVSENDRLAGLGIHDFATRSVSDVSFAHSARRVPHARTTSVGSQMSTGSGSTRLGQPFVHPMRQTPQPYTPPTGSANASFVNDYDASESDDVLDDDFKLGAGFRSKRSMSISSTPAIVPTPLSQSHTAHDLGMVPKLTSISQTNLSVKSGKSGKSSKSRLGRTRRETGPSFDLPTSPSSRTSFDRAFSFVSRKSDPDPQNRDERIRAARRKFEEKEASKDHRQEKEHSKRRQSEEANRARKQERQRQKSQTRERHKLSKSDHSIPARSRGSPKKSKRDTENDQEQLASRSYDEYRPANQMSLPRVGREAGMSEKVHRAQERKPKAQTGFVRFSAWLQTRMLNCGGR